MTVKKQISNFLIAPCVFVPLAVAAQISPGPLATLHSHLEGLSNCTKCHSLGSKVTNDKCLECHTEIRTRVLQDKGYHASVEISGKACITCHSDHHGLAFDLIRFRKESFNHQLTGFRLEGAHAAKACADCHKTGFITDPAVKDKKFTYLGVSPECRNCHIDVHQKSLSSACSACHGNESFKPAVKFSHDKTRFPLEGKHQAVPCTGCHPVTSRNGASFQEFAGIRYQQCNACHTDVHKNKFGQNCTQCHTVESFHTVRGISNFDHTKTGFPLENKHQSVPCQSCHKNNLTDPVRHARCTDCHPDYHEGQFSGDDSMPDCSNCHTTSGFSGSSFTIERHNLARFQLEGAHIAIPCFSCHKKAEKWQFREIGIRCADCHPDIHFPQISSQYYPESRCGACHFTSRWDTISFQHASTGFPLTGAHEHQTCRRCHFRQEPDGSGSQVFKVLTSDCGNCHEDIHFRQFERDGKTDCQRCHNSGQWKIPAFDHNTTGFKLDGMHAQVPCAGCHKPVRDGQRIFVLYHLKDSRCESCH